MAEIAKWIIMVIILSLLMTGCGQGEKPNLQDQLDQVQHKLTATEIELAKLRMGQKQMEDQLASLEGSLSQLSGNLDLFQRQLASLQPKVGELTVPLPVPRTATRVVAASNSSDLGKKQADYVCDGTDDEVQIQMAIDALPAEGGKVLLLEGLYIIGTGITLPDNTTFEGQGFGTVIKIKDGHNDSINMVGNVDYDNGNTQIVIRNLRLDGNRLNNATTYQRGVFLLRVTYSIVNQVLVENFWDIGIAFWAPGNYYNIVTENIVRNCYNKGTKGNIYLDGFSNGVCSNNVIYDNNGTGATSALLVNCGGNRVTITGNTLYNSADMGIAVYASIDLNISGNVIWDCGGDAIRLEYGMQNCTISNNVINDCLGGGIHLFSNTCKENVISGNAITYHRHGIYLDNADHNTIIGNRIGDANASNYDGIFLVDSEYNLIEANSIRKLYHNVQRYGINISDAGCVGNIVRGNDLRDSGVTANFNDAGTLTHVEGNNGTEITDNKIYQLMKNTSGGALVAGDVVILKAVAAGNEITATTTQGDDMVFGIVAEAIDNNASGLIQVGGKITALKVDGTTDIAIGDLLGTFTTAKIAMKAAAGDMAFAIALEAYTTDDSNGVIDALLIIPRKV